MTTGYDPKSYWEQRLTEHAGLCGTGHISFGIGYNEWLYRAKLRRLEDVIADREIAGKEVLDVGCGTGFFVDWYRSHGAHVSGIDITERSINALRKRLDGDFRVLDVSAPDARLTTRYDIVNVWDVMYHIVDEDGFARALRLLASSVNAEGLLLVSDQFGAKSDRRVAPHVRLRCLSTYQSQLGPQGFELVQIKSLFRWLNRYVSLPAIDGRLGRLYYWLDGRQRRVPADNLSLALWRRIASS